MRPEQRRAGCTEPWVQAKSILSRRNPGLTGGAKPARADVGQHRQPRQLSLGRLPQDSLELREEISFFQGLREFRDRTPDLVDVQLPLHPLD
jgi:hypothetical protein